MKIAVILWELDITGGTQRLALELAKNMQKLGHEVDVYSYFYDEAIGYKDLFDGLSIKGVTKRTRTKTTQTQKPKNILTTIIYFLRIYVKIIKNFFSPEESVLKLKDLVLKTHPINYYDAINIHDYNAYRVARLIKHQNIVWTMNDIQRPPIKSRSQIHETLFNFIQKILIRIETSNIKNIIVLDNRNVALCKNYFNKDAIIVRGGINIEMFNQIKKKDFDKKDFDIFLSSIFFPHRRFEDVVNAAEIIKKRGYNNFKIQINGITERDYEYYLSIKNLISDKDLNNYISITTGLSEKELFSAYEKADIFIFPNHNQTWGLVVFEAMLAGCVTIVSKTSGASEILNEGENSFLVDPKSPDQIAEILIKLFKTPLLLKTVSDNAISFVKNNLSWERYARETLAIFEKK